MAFEWFKKLKSGLSNSASKVEKALSNVVGKKKLGEHDLTELEDQLIMSDLGTNFSTSIVEKIRKHNFILDKGNSVISKLDILNVVMKELGTILKPCEKNLFIKRAKKPTVILVCGVNGSGKTTTIGKLSKRFKNDGQKVVIAACDTFRAAAVAQLQSWSEKTDAIFVSGNDGSDSASVAYKALKIAIHEKADYLLVDTAGRLQNKTDLMDELLKTTKVMERLLPGSPHEKIVVLDATVGQNAHSQLQIFNDKIGITGIIVTKLDGSAKGGVVISLAEKFKLPIFAVGVGESTNDLDVFNSEDYTRALLGID